MDAENVAPAIAAETVSAMSMTSANRAAATASLRGSTIAESYLRPASTLTTVNAPTKIRYSPYVPGSKTFEYVGKEPTITNCPAAVRAPRPATREATLEIMPENQLTQ